MTLDELKVQVANDLKVNDERLDTESLKNQELYAKYLEIKSNFELLMYKAKGDYKILYRDKWEYYGGKADAKIYETKPFDLKVLKSDLSIYIESDEEIIQQYAANQYAYYNATEIPPGQAGQELYDSLPSGTVYYTVEGGFNTKP